MSRIPGMLPFADNEALLAGLRVDPPNTIPSNYCTSATPFEKRPVFNPVASYWRLVPPVNETCLATIAV